MMKLSTMGLGDQRRDQAGKLPLAALAYTRWSHDPGSLTLFRYSSNFLYRFTDQGETRYLRSAHAAQRNKAQIEAEMALLQWLTGEGIGVAAPLPSVSGKVVESVETEVGTFHSVVFAGLAGVHHDSDDLDVTGFHAWGLALGELHAALRRYPGQATADRPSWRDDLALAERLLSPHDAAVQREIAQISAGLAALPVTPETYGLIHYDFELDNIIWQDGLPTIIDFDDAAHHWFAADISFALRDLFDHGITPDDPRSQAFLVAYRERSPLSAEMLASVPLFSRLQRLTGYGRIARSLDLDPESVYPPWLRDLEGRLKGMLDAYATTLAR